MKNGDIPAAPIYGADGSLWNLTDGNHDGEYLSQVGQKFSIGITKREHFAAMAMQGILSGADEYRKENWTNQDYAFEAVVMADALLEELKKENRR